MKNAHLYNLKVEFNRPDIRWNINILAINTNAVCMWITDKQDTEKIYIKKVSIELIMLDYQLVQDNFLAQAQGV